MCLRGWIAHYFYPWITLHSLDGPFLCIHSTTEGHLGCFQFWVIISKADINNHLCSTLQRTPILITLVITHKFTLEALIM